MTSLRTLQEQPEFTAIVLSYKRPQNIQSIVESLLHTPSVGSVLLSNNNPDIAISDWVKIQDPRLRIISQVIPRRCVHRFLLARKEPAKYFLFVDDDIFLTPSQLEKLCGELRRDPSRPHGVFGQKVEPESQTLTHAHRGNSEVDVLNRVYAFTEEHLDRFFELSRSVGKLYGRSPWHIRWWDDLGLSFSGKKKPLIWDVGPFVDCPTENKQGIATWREEGFFDFRQNLFQRLRSLVTF